MSEKHRLASPGPQASAGERGKEIKTNKKEWEIILPDDRAPSIVTHFFFFLSFS